MKLVIVGHRGVGKTNFLKRHQNYFPSILHFDLDAEIEKKIEISIQDFFLKFSEKNFREIEKETYQKITSENKNYVIALGAGFPISEIKPDDEVLFISRITDAKGRLFLNRPRLNSDLSALDESLALFSQREAVYRARANSIYYMPEGLEAQNEIEEKLIKKDFLISDAFYTLSENEIQNIAEKIKNFSRIELRTDLILQNNILQLLEKFPKQNWMLSVRDDQKFILPKIASMLIDVDVQFVPQHKNKLEISIVSSHADKIDQGLKDLSPFEEKCKTKLCPVVEDFSDLIKGYSWQQADPEKRNFLPRSKNGKWTWFRMFSKYQQEINFVKGFTQQNDQPSPYQWLSLPNQRPKSWAAVVGKPLLFSRSPIRHQNYFKKINSYMAAIELDTQELKNHINWLNQLGLNYSAVTSPLKETAFSLCKELTNEANEIKSVNTILIKSKHLKGHNTDSAGFGYLLNQANIQPTDKIAVWGGGGTLAMMQQQLPQADFYSSQSGSLKFSKMPSTEDYTVLVWAAPRAENTLMPPLNWPIQKIIDLNYVENSLGLEFAQKMISAGHKVQYISGLMMFNEQALKQQDFWSQA